MRLMRDLAMVIKTVIKVAVVACIILPLAFFMLMLEDDQG